VLPIGGLKEKLLAALRSGIKTVLIPEENTRDLKEIPENVTKGMEIIHKLIKKSDILIENFAPDVMGKLKLDYEQVKRYIEREIVEVIPLAYMRGRTLANAFIILDEGQNTTSAQMKMFLTRMGEGSRIVVTGDITQIDLEGEPSGLVEARRILAGVPGIGWSALDRRDIVRHALVAEIVDAYERHRGQDGRQA
ncbi:MAG: hypothetical protein GYA73_12275, partial [Planctomycetes bacterium]|nr:hypothetical protein [Planctomycetota bacterium]